MPDLRAESRLVHRELVRLIALIAITIGAFVLTRTAAASNAAIRVRDAAAWFQRSSHMPPSTPDARTVAALRRAVAKDPGKADYRLALASALQASGDDVGAERLLIALRERSPEDPQVNLQLARLDARRGNIDTSRRYYQSALGGLWRPDQEDARRRVRLELVMLLLAHDQRGRALPEVLALTVDAPDKPDVHVEIGTLLLDAGDPRRARDHFLRALRVDPDRADALIGAGRAAFAIGDYTAARRYLEAANVTDPDAIELRDIARLVLTIDPLEPRIRPADRRSRMDVIVRQALRRLEACGVQTPAPDPSRLQSRRIEANSLLQRATARTATDAHDLAEDAIDLAARAEAAAAESCGPATSPLDRAIVLIARRRGIAPA